MQMMGDKVLRKVKELLLITDEKNRLQRVVAVYEHSQMTLD
jgi:hypothetical protein